MERKIVFNDEIEINSFGGVACRLTLTSPDCSPVTLVMDRQQNTLLQNRFVRQYLVLISESRLIDMIDKAPNYSELERVARKYSLCDVCDFSDINIYGAKRALKVIVNTLYRYPKLRGKFCYIGSPEGYLRQMERLAAGDMQILRDFGLQYICEKSISHKLGEMMRHVARSVLEGDRTYIAMAVSAFGLFDAILLDSEDYEGYAYIKLVSDLKQDMLAGFHPQGCYTPESVIYHEIGHLIDYLCGLSENPRLLSFVRPLTQRDVERGLSRYATTSTAELVAEAFAEYICNPTPRPIAAKIGQLIESEYSKL